MALFDIESDYRMVPVHRLLLGMEWKGQLFVDTALPFGLRSAPKIFNAVADGLQWIFEEQGISPIIHILCFWDQQEVVNAKCFEKSPWVL